MRLAPKNSSLANKQKMDPEEPLPLDLSQDQPENFSQESSIASLYDNVSEPVMMTVEPEDLVVGDHIYVTYIPDSQRYMDEDEYQPRQGIVVQTGKNLEDIRIVDHAGDELGIAPPGLHMYDMCRGYAAIISIILSSDDQ